ncbi:kinase RLK-Pelle-LRR-I-1 family protein [Tanacetum coccineum]
MTIQLKQLEHMRIQLKVIKLATKNFSSEYCIVSGGFGTVYKTELDHVDRRYCLAIEGENVPEVPKKKSTVAVKRIFDTENESSEQGFYAEIEMLTSCKHSNILTLLGFCDEGSAMILVYKYAHNGSLVDYLRNRSNMTNDNWAQRMKICLHVAKGLSYLHTGDEGRQEIVHRDIKSANILLDENLDAKIGDFGLCKFFFSENEEHNKHYSSGAAGTKVYMDPQYAKEGKMKKELDVYCLGVVMSEILCGRLAYDTIYNSHNSKGLALTARWHVENKTVQEFVDPRMKEGITEAILPSIKRLYQNSFDMFSNIAYKCLDETQANRPTLECVIKELEEALPFQLRCVHGLLDGTFTSTILKRNVTAKDVWKSLADLFHDNKEARSMELHEELLEIGSLSIAEYFKKIKLIFDLLSNIDSTLSEKNLLMLVLCSSLKSLVSLASKDGTLLKTPLPLPRFCWLPILVQTKVELTKNFAGISNVIFVVLVMLPVCSFSWVSEWSNNNATWPGPHTLPHAHVTNSSSGILGPTPYSYIPYGNVDQPTAIPRVFNATTLRYADNNDFGLYMDTGATLQLSVDAGERLPDALSTPPM